MDFDGTADFWLNDYPSLSERTRSIIVSSFTAKASTLLRSPLRRLFCSDTTVSPADSCAGKVIVIDLPVKEYGEAGRFAQVLFKTVWQRDIERRRVDQSTRPVFLWADESQYFVTSEDMLFQQTARSALAGLFTSRRTSRITTRSLGPRVGRRRPTASSATSRRRSSMRTGTRRPTNGRSGCSARCGIQAWGTAPAMAVRPRAFTSSNGQSSTRRSVRRSPRAARLSTSESKGSCSSADADGLLPERRNCSMRSNKYVREPCEINRPHRSRNREPGCGHSPRIGSSLGPSRKVCQMALHVGTIDKNLDAAWANFQDAGSFSRIAELTAPLMLIRPGYPAVEATAANIAAKLPRTPCPLPWSNSIESVHSFPVPQATSKGAEVLCLLYCMHAPSRSWTFPLPMWACGVRTRRRAPVVKSGHK